MFYISGLRRLEKPVLDLNIARTSPELYSVGNTYRIAALPGGGAVIRHYIYNNWTEQILKINSQGKVTQTIYTCVGCSFIYGLLVLGDYLYITHNDGTVIKTWVSNGQLVSTSNIPDVRSVTHTGSLSNKPEKIPDKQTLLLCDWIKGEVFTFKPSTVQKQVHVTSLKYPKSVSYFFYNHSVFYIVSYFFYNHSVFYIVCEGIRDRINVYNQTWHLIRTIGTKGSDDGELQSPQSAIVSDEDTIIISDWRNHRVSEFSFNGTFLRHLLVSSDGIYWPFSMSYYYPHLWLDQNLLPHNKLYRYNLYRSVNYLSIIFLKFYINY